MNLLNKIKNAVDASPIDDKLYLIGKYSDKAGLFICNKRLLYIVKNTECIDSNALQTEYLKLQSNTTILSVENFQKFNSGVYNLIEYKLPYDENTLAFEAFLNLCLAHIRLMDSKNFLDFFKSLIDLFKNEKKERKQNIYGLFGELSIIYYFYAKYNINLVPYWHTSGIYSKYDFSFNQKNIEVKTANSIKNVYIKHSQIFNKEQNYLAVALVENNNSGISLKDLEEKLLAIDTIGSNFNFLLSLEAEKARIDISDFSNKKLKLIDVNVYDCEKINPFIKIPENISDIEYRIDLVNYDQIANERIKKFLD